MVNVNMVVKRSVVKRLELLNAINELLNVAEKLNNGWKPNFNIVKQQKYFIDSALEGKKRYLFLTSGVSDCFTFKFGCFKTRELGKKAIKMLSDKTKFILWGVK